MSDFRRLSESVLAGPQIGIEDVAQAKAMGVSLIINNRPDDEEPGQIAGATIERAARAAGIDYLAIPIGHSGFGKEQIEAMACAVMQADGLALAYCRSGTRSTFLWALAQASQGGDPETLLRAASAAGYDVSPIRPTLEALAQEAK